MSGTVRRWPDVDRDVLGLAQFIARDSVETALRFFDGVDATIAGLARMPGKGAVRNFRARKLRDVRSYPIDGFPNHLVFYQVTPRGIDVIAVLHGARDIPRALRERQKPPDLFGR